MNGFAVRVALAAAIVASPLVIASPADAASQSGYGYYSESIYTGGTPVSVSYEVFVSVSYTYANAYQVQILAGRSSLRACLKNAQTLYERTGYISSWKPGWYIWSDTNGDIDSDPLGGPISGAWPACSGSYDWQPKAVTSRNHWPPHSTRVKGRTIYCIERSINQGIQSGCSGYKTTLSGYMR